MTRLIFFLLALLFLIWLISGSGHLAPSISRSPESVLANPSSSIVPQDCLLATVLIQIETPQGNTHCTGFIVDQAKGWIITCYHAVKTAKSIRVQFPILEHEKIVTDPNRYSPVDAERISKGKIQAAKLIKFTKECDLGLLQLEKPIQDDYPKVIVASHTTMPGESLLVVGHPAVRNEWWISREAEAGQTEARIIPLADYQLSTRFLRSTSKTPLEHGYSGAPVFHAQSRKLVGLVSGSQGNHSTTFFVITHEDIITLLQP